MFSPREVFPDCSTARPAPSTPVVVSTPTTITNDRALHRNSTPTAPEVSMHQTPIDPPPTQLAIPSNLIDTIKAHAGTSIALVSGAIGLAAAIEDSSCLLQLSELGSGLIGLVCAGRVVLGGVALDNVGEGIDTGVEEVWGKVWRWMKDLVVGVDGQDLTEEVEVEEVMMFDEEGNKVFLQDAPPATPPSMTIAEPRYASPPISQQSSGPGSYRKKTGRPALPAFTFPPIPDTRPLNSPPSPPRQEYAYASCSTQPSLKHPVPRPRADQAASGLLHSQTYADGSHASGLLRSLTDASASRCTAGF